MKNYHDDIHQKIEELPTDLQNEVEDFIDFVRQKHPQQKEEHLDLSWAGGLSEYKDEYTSVELAEKAMQWRKD